jgi:predicted outer membrane repeat protein
MANDMNLTLPTVSTTPGPTWANQINDALSTVSNHNHAPGNGAPIPSSALNIDADLSFAGNRATNLGGSLYTNLTATPTFTNGVYCRSGNLYFRDGAGNEIPITSGGNVVGSAGTITGMSGTTAAATYDSGSATFIFTQDTNQAASLDAGPITIRKTSASAAGITIEPSSGLVSGYTLSLPASLPASAQSVFSVSTSGAVTNAAPDSTISVTASQIKVANSGITATQLATGSVTAIKMGALTYAAGSSTGNSYTITASPTPTAIPALYSVFVAVNTRPMIITLDNDQSGTASSVGSAGVWNIYFEVVGPSGTTQVANTHFAANMYPPVGGICGFYVPAVGVHTIQAYVTRTVSGSISISNTRLVVYQL